MNLDFNLRAASVPHILLIRCICHSGHDPGNMTGMKIAKPLLLVTTPLGLLEGFYECYRLAGGLLFLMAAMVGVMVTALATVVATIRREERESKTRST
jgi:hypothetical protein